MTTSVLRTGQRFVAMLSVFVAVMPCWAQPPAARREGGRYLIVAAPTFAASPRMADFVHAKEARGFSVTLHSVPIGSSAEQIKDTIEAWYVSGVPSYVLVVGDNDDAPVPSSHTEIPYWQGDRGPTDLHYACLEGGDMHPDVYLGRFSIDTEVELGTIIDKTLFVEAGVYDDPDYAKRAVFAATGDAIADAESAHDAVITPYLDPAGFTSTRAYVNEGGTGAQVVDAIDDGSLFAVYMGHSSHGGWWDPAYHLADLQAGTNTGSYGILLSFSCSVNGFNWFYNECLGEQWLRASGRGGVASIASTTIIDTASPGGWDANHVLEEGFFKAMIEDGIWEVGPAWHAAQDALIHDPRFDPHGAYTQAYLETYILLGDPSLIVPHEPVANGDYDGDGDVDMVDCFLFQSCFGDPATGPCAAGNLAGGDRIDLDDYAVFCHDLAGP